MNIIEHFAWFRFLEQSRCMATLCSCADERSASEQYHQAEFEHSISLLPPVEVDQFTGESLYDPSDDGTPRDFFQPRWRD